MSMAPTTSAPKPSNNDRVRDQQRADAARDTARAEAAKPKQPPAPVDTVDASGGRGGVTARPVNVTDPTRTTTAPVTPKTGLRNKAAAAVPAPNAPAPVAPAAEGPAPAQVGGLNQTTGVRVQVLPSDQPYNVERRAYAEMAKQAGLSPAAQDEFMSSLKLGAPTYADQNGASTGVPITRSDIVGQTRGPTPGAGQAKPMQFYPKDADMRALAQWKERDIANQRAAAEAKANAAPPPATSTDPVSVVVDSVQNPGDEIGLTAQASGSLGAFANAGAAGQADAVLRRTADGYELQVSAQAMPTIGAEVAKNLGITGGTGVLGNVTFKYPTREAAMQGMRDIAAYHSNPGWTGATDVVRAASGDETAVGRIMRSVDSVEAGAYSEVSGTVGLSPVMGSGTEAYVTAKGTAAVTQKNGRDGSITWTVKQQGELEGDATSFLGVGGKATVSSEHSVMVGGGDVTAQLKLTANAYGHADKGALVAELQEGEGIERTMTVSMKASEVDPRVATCALRAAGGDVAAMKELQSYPGVTVDWGTPSRYRHDSVVVGAGGSIAGDGGALKFEGKRKLVQQPRP